MEGTPRHYCDEKLVKKLAEEEERIWRAVGNKQWMIDRHADGGAKLFVVGDNDWEEFKGEW